jgi:hypothetical protein
VSITYHRDLVQGSEEWLQARCGIFTASEMKLILTTTLKPASNDKERAHLCELAAQRITQHVEPHYIGDDMLRGMEDEIAARELYSEHYAPVEEVGFITNDRWGYTLGYSPDGLVGNDGLIECKSRRQKFQIKTIADLAVPDDYLLQVQTGLLVSERKWLDFISFCGGMPMVTLRVYPDERVQAAILEAAEAAEQRIQALVDRYAEKLAEAKARLIPTERRIEQEMFA